MQRVMEWFGRVLSRGLLLAAAVWGVDYDEADVRVEGLHISALISQRQAERQLLLLLFLFVRLLYSFLLRAENLA